MDDITPSMTETAEETLAGLEPLARLEERILATVEQLRVARHERAQAESDRAALRDQLARAEQEGRKFRGEADALRKERRQILERVERLLTQVEKLPQD